MTEKKRNKVFLKSCRYGSYDLISKLIEEGNLDINYADENGWSGLHYAAMANDLPLVTMLLAKGANPNHVDCTKLTALHRAVSHSNTEMIKVLLDYGAFPFAQDAFGDTPLIRAIKMKAEEEKFNVCLLLAEKMEPRHIKNLINEKLENALDIALKRNYLEIYELLDKRCFTIEQQQDSTHETGQGSSTTTEPDKLECLICRLKPRDRSFGCGHGCCSDCASQLELCHICRKAIECVIPLYL